MAWAKITRSMCHVAGKTGERNIIMPLFANWANRIQEKHQKPLLQCPEASKIDLSFVAHITPQDWRALSEQLPLQPSNQHLASALMCNNIDLAAMLIDMSLPTAIHDEQEARDLFRTAALSRISSHQFVLLLKNTKANNPGLSCQWLAEVLLRTSRLDVLVDYFDELSPCQIKEVENHLLIEASKNDESWLRQAAASGLITKILQLHDHNYLSAFRTQLNRLIRQNGRLAKFFT